MEDVEIVEINAEYLAQMYFRINGFFVLSDFIVHTDISDTHEVRTDIDFCGIRYPNSKLFFKDPIEDDVFFRQFDHPLCIICEVKLNSKCQINPTLTQNDTLERVLQIIGVNNSELNLSVAEELRTKGLCKKDGFSFQFASIGRKENVGLKNIYPNAIQITWDHLLKFIQQRFIEAYRQKRNNVQWESIGRGIFSLANKFEEFSEFKKRISISNKIEKNEKYVIVMNKVLGWPFDFQHAVYKISKMGNRPKSMFSLKNYLLNTHFNGRMDECDEFLKCLEKEELVTEKSGKLEYRIEKIIQHPLSEKAS